MTDLNKLLLAVYNKCPSWAFPTSKLFSLTDTFIPVNRLDRNARVLREQGCLQRISNDDDKARYGYFGKEDLYLLTEKGKEEARKLGQQAFTFATPLKPEHLFKC